MSNTIHGEFVFADANVRLTYQFLRPTKSAVALALAGLPTLDGEFIAIRHQDGESVAEIVGRVRDASWARNTQVWGEDSDGVPRIYFGRLLEYLRDDRRFRVLVTPAYCRGCEGNRRVTFLPYSDTGYLVGGRRVSD